MIDAKQAATLLGVAPRTVLELAAPRGPLPCYRIGRAVRFKPEDVEGYRESCRLNSTAGTSVGGGISTTRTQVKDTDLASYFRQVGVNPRRSNSTETKRQERLSLSLVKSGHPQALSKL